MNDLNVVIFMVNRVLVDFLKNFVELYYLDYFGFEVVDCNVNIKLLLLIIFVNGVDVV